MTVPLNSPLELADGDGATVTLGYDILGAYCPDTELDESHPPTGVPHDHWYCADASRDPKGGPCLLFTGFSPSAAKNGP